MTAGPYAALVAAHGLSPAHRLLIAAVPAGARTLDVGCATHGLFDRTHLRFFTRAGARAFVAGAGLRVRSERFPPAPLPLQARVPALRRLEAPAARAWPELFALQVVLAAEPAVSGPSTPGRASR